MKLIKSENYSNFHVSVFTFLQKKICFTIRYNKIIKNIHASEKTQVLLSYMILQKRTLEEIDNKLIDHYANFVNINYCYLTVVEDGINIHLKYVG